MREDRFGELWQRAGPLQDDITVDNVAQALREALQPEMRTRAQEVASRIEQNGAPQRETHERIQLVDL